MNSLRVPAPRPCESCPYRQDVPPGVWHLSEYRKLIEYDKPTGEQPVALFQCHQNDPGDESARICGGWAGVHGQEALALRMAIASGAIDPDTGMAAMDYQSPVPLFASGAEAAAHGIMDDPGPEAQAIMAKIRQRRDLS